MSMITEQVERLRELSKQDKLGLIPWNGYSEILNQAADTIEQLASKVRPITGHWIPQEMETYIDGKLKHWKAYKCNKCNNLLTDDYEYCPNCGAKMHLLIEEMTGDEWVDDVVESMKGETWNGIHAQITAPKGTFERIFNDADDDNEI